MGGGGAPNIFPSYLGRHHTNRDFRCDHEKKSNCWRVITCKKNYIIQLWYLVECSGHWWISIKPWSGGWKRSSFSPLLVMFEWWFLRVSKYVYSFRTFASFDLSCAHMSCHPELQNNTAVQGDPLVLTSPKPTASKREETTIRFNLPTKENLHKCIPCHILVVLLYNLIFHMSRYASNPVPAKSKSKIIRIPSLLLMAEIR